MPIPLPKASRRVVARVQPATDWTGIWAGSIGAVAVGLAAFVLIAGRSPVAAASVLVAIATIVAVVLHQGAQPPSD